MDMKAIYGSLKVIEVHHKVHNKLGATIATVILCKCDCGRECLRKLKNLESGKHVDCGCNANEQGWNKYFMKSDKARDNI
jgi:hypothetical protein